MKNLSRILDRENKWYKIGPISIPRGVPKRAPFYFTAIEAGVYLLDQIPFSPIWLINQMNSGWCITYIIVPVFLTAYLQSIKKAGKTPERYLMTMINFKLSNKHVNPYTPLEKTTIYQFDTPYTIRFGSRKEENHEEDRLSNQAY